MLDINTAINTLSWQKEPLQLYAPIEYTLQSGGKRLRPTLVLLANEMFGGNQQEALHAALAIEIFHNFTLLHDDVMDKALVRRGKPTVHRQWSENAAILSGDQMMIEAYKQLAQLPDKQLPTVLRLFNEMATGICEGQQYDMEFEQKQDVTLDDYLTMIRLKTAVLLAYALQIGAYIGSADNEQQQQLFNYGIHLGLAFQIQDDLLDVYGNPLTFGKAIGGDILCGKKTYLLLTALNKADATTKQELTNTLTANIDDEEKIASVRSIYDRLGVKHSAEQAIEEHTAQAIAALQQLPQNEQNKTLYKLAQQLSNRQS